MLAVPSRARGAPNLQDPLRHPDWFQENALACDAAHADLATNLQAPRLVSARPQAQSARFVVHSFYAPYKNVFAISHYFYTFCLKVPPSRLLCQYELQQYVKPLALAW